MDFPLAGSMGEAACSARLVEALHPDGLARPRCGGDHYGVHRRHRGPVIDYRRRDCRRASDAFTGTALRGTGRTPSALVLILRGIAQGTPTARPARELGRDRMKLLQLRHKPQDRAAAGLAPFALDPGS